MLFAESLQLTSFPPIGQLISSDADLEIVNEALTDINVVYENNSALNFKIVLVCRTRI